MGPIDLLLHVLNFLAPALWTALAVALLSRWVMKQKSSALTLRKQVVLNFSASALTLVLGLWWFGNDGKMATFSAMVLVCATSQWFMLRGWRG